MKRFSLRLTCFCIPQAAKTLESSVVLTEADSQQWRADFLAQLPENLSPKRKAWIKQSLPGEKWAKIAAKPIFGNLYHWAAFTISGKSS